MSNALLIRARNQIIQQLWQRYIKKSVQMQNLLRILPQQSLVLDHFAIIDLPGIHTGISVLNQIFSALLYLPQGRDYLAEKQNAFMWLAPAEACTQQATAAQPQIVIADFMLEDLPINLQQIIVDYMQQTPAFPWRFFHQLCGQVYHGDEQAAAQLGDLIVAYCWQRDWPLPTCRDYLQIKEANELLAWVLASGRCVNHFGIAVHHLPQFADLNAFNAFAEKALQTTLNAHGDVVIKGGAAQGIAQSATVGETLTFMLADGNVSLPSPFIEFVWRYSKIAKPVQWMDYFTGFIGAQATHVIESVYAA